MRRKTKLQVVRATNARVETLTPIYRRAAVKLLGRERGEVTAYLANSARSGDSVLKAALRAIERAYTDKKGAYYTRWVESYVDLNRTTYNVAGASLASKTGLNFNLRPSDAIDAATTRAEQLADYVGETTAARITDSVTRVLDAGGDYRAVRDDLLDGAFGEDISIARADRIARTEVHGALNEGEFERASANSDILTRKQWLHSGNGRNPRDWHVDMDGETVGIDEDFSNGLQFPGESGAPAEEVINCGCTCLYLSDVDEA